MGTVPETETETETRIDRAISLATDRESAIGREIGTGQGIVETGEGIEAVIAAVIVAEVGAVIAVVTETGTSASLLM